MLICDVFQYDRNVSFEANKLSFINQAYFERSDAIKHGYSEDKFDVNKVEERFNRLFSHYK
jgi:hypothetical protein|tara:strand:- start:299 stop:481 length:183 start_codon:yes stop_codon:yes gene_type:complete